MSLGALAVGVLLLTWLAWGASPVLATEHEPEPTTTTTVAPEPTTTTTVAPEPTTTTTEPPTTTTTEPPTTTTTTPAEPSPSEPVDPLTGWESTTTPVLLALVGLVLGLVAGHVTFRAWHD